VPWAQGFAVFSATRLDEVEREEARALVRGIGGHLAAHEIARDYAAGQRLRSGPVGEGLIPKALVEFGYNVVDDLPGVHCESPRPELSN